MVLDYAGRFDQRFGILLAHAQPPHASDTRCFDFSLSWQHTFRLPRQATL
jgi:hypothetical protein